MGKVIEKLDNYNLFTNIIPGYVMLLFNIYYFKLNKPNVVELIIIAYFIGQTLNRLGSILIGKLLLYFTSDKGLSYDKYILACEKDKKINLLLQERNAYRTFCTLFIVCIIEIIFSKVLVNFNISCDIIVVAMLLLCLIIYSISFCKYNKYIIDRVQISNKKENNYIKKTK